MLSSFFLAVDIDLEVLDIIGQNDVARRAAPWKGLYQTLKSLSYRRLS